MKMTRSELKLLIKECLIEILCEGVGSLNTNTIDIVEQRQTTTVNAKPKIVQQPKIAQQQSKKHPLDMPALDATIKRQANGNKIMEQVLRETAMTTVPKMLKQDNGAQQIQRKEHIGDPIETFGQELTDKWASLAMC